MVMTTTDLFSDGVVEVASACGADPGVRVPSFVYAASNQASLLWRDGIEWSRVISDEMAREVSGMPLEYTLYEISDLLTQMGDVRAEIVACCYDCDVKWSFWSDRECWMCGKVGYLYTPRNIRSIIKYKDWYASKE